MSDTIRVSVIMPVHNGAGDLLRAAVQSVLSQGPVLERLIIVDDGSTAATTRAALAAVSALPDVQVITLPANRGVSAARNAGIAAAPSPWIGFCDADDLVEPGWLDAAAAAIRRYPAARWVMGRHMYLFPDGRRAPRRTFAEDLGRSFDEGHAVIHSGPEFVRAMIFHFTGHIGAVLATKSLLRDAGGFNTDLEYWEDHLLRLKCSVIAPLLELDVPAYLYRRGIPSVMTRPKAMTEAYVRGWSVARRDPLLRDYRRELRWAEYSARKALALKNLYRGNRAQGLRLAASALAMDPREVKDFATFLSLMRKPPETLVTEGVRYSLTPVKEEQTALIDPPDEALTPLTRTSRS